MTKLHEETLRTTLQGALEHYQSNAPKGEYVLVVEGCPPPAEPAATLESGVEQVLALREQGIRLKDAARQVAQRTGPLQKRAVCRALER